MGDILRYSFEVEDDVRIISVTGNITAVTCINLEYIMWPITNNGNSIISMKNVQIVTVAGINSLVTISHNARSKEHIVILLEAAPAIKDLAVQMSLSMVLTFADTKAEAMLKIQNYV